MAGDCDIEDERVNDHKDLQSAQMRCKNAMQNGHPYLIDGTIDKRFDGKDSHWYDFQSDADGISRQS